MTLLGLGSNKIYNLIPITVIAAVLIFVIKEALDIYKKSKEKKRKIAAMKLLLIEEIELNHWVWKSMNSLISDLNDRMDDIDSLTIEVTETKSGTESITGTYPNGDMFGQDFPRVRVSRYHQLAIDLAIVDEKFYEKVKSCYEAVSELNHLRDGVYTYFDTDSIEYAFREGYILYAKDHLSEIKIKMNELYIYCTGNALEKFRLR